MQKTIAPASKKLSLNTETIRSLETRENVAVLMPTYPPGCTVAY